MKKHLILIIVLCFAATLQLKAQKEYTVSSPNGTLELKIITEDTLSYQLFSGGRIPHNMECFFHTSQRFDL